MLRATGSANVTRGRTSCGVAGGVRYPEAVSTADLTTAGVEKRCRIPVMTWSMGYSNAPEKCSARTRRPEMRDRRRVEMKDARSAWEEFVAWRR